MTAFADALSTLCLTQEEATGLLPSRTPGELPRLSLVKDWARGKTRVPTDVWDRLCELFDMVEVAADDILAAQGERTNGECTLPLEIEIDAIPLPHPSLRRAAFVRARLVSGRGLVCRN